MKGNKNLFHNWADSSPYLPLLKSSMTMGLRHHIKGNFIRVIEVWFQRQIPVKIFNAATIAFQFICKFYKQFNWPKHVHWSLEYGLNPGLC